MNNVQIVIISGNVLHIFHVLPGVADLLSVVIQVPGCGGAHSFSWTAAYLAGALAAHLCTAKTCWWYVMRHTLNAICIKSCNSI